MNLGCNRCSINVRSSIRYARTIQTTRQDSDPDDGQSNTIKDVQPTPSTDGASVTNRTHHMRLKANQKDFVIDVLGASTTKREAKSYLSRFHPEPRKLEFKQPSTRARSQTSNGVNLGNLFQKGINKQPLDAVFEDVTPSKPRHVAMVLLRAPDTISDEVLHGVTRTLSQLSQLGMHCIVMVDLRDYLSIAERRFDRDRARNSQEAERRHKILAQADRIVDALEQHLDQRARRLDYLFKVDSHSADLKHLTRGRISPDVENLHLLEQCLDSGAIPVVSPIVRTKNLKLQPFHSKEALIALSRALAGTADLVSSQESVREKISSLAIKDSSGYSVDRIIVLDSSGGIPAGPSFEKAHTFINLEQEYETIRTELDHISHTDPPLIARKIHKIQPLAVEHLKNLSLARRALKFLPSTSSALITSPEAVARYEYSSVQPETPAVGTRPQRNILIHNLLTDKPIRSSSLPPTRLATVPDEDSVNEIKLSATFLKHGMPVTIIPQPSMQPWKPPMPSSHMLSLDDPRLDIKRLVHLIEDSFGRPLNQEHYFSRIAPSLAGIIIAGEYEGCAILTWERPPSASADESTRFVPYLDKFAVLKRSQGAGGVADIVFSAMVRDCFPQGVCWRSRSNNPVNKWYFERATGTYKLPVKDEQDASAQSWTMFWTTKGMEEAQFNDYAEVCSSIASSWADGKSKLD